MTPRVSVIGSAFPATASSTPAEPWEGLALNAARETGVRRIQRMEERRVLTPADVGERRRLGRVLLEAAGRR